MHQSIAMKCNTNEHQQRKQSKAKRWRVEQASEQANGMNE
jgi:hypothetical protein